MPIIPQAPPGGFVFVTASWFCLRGLFSLSIVFAAARGTGRVALEDIDDVFIVVGNVDAEGVSGGCGVSGGELKGILPYLDVDVVILAETPPGAGVEVFALFRGRGAIAAGQALLEGFVPVHYLVVFQRPGYPELPHLALVEVDVDPGIREFSEGTAEIEPFVLAVLAVQVGDSYGIGPFEKNVLGLLFRRSPRHTQYVVGLERSHGLAVFPLAVMDDFA